MTALHAVVKMLLDTTATSKKPSQLKEGDIILQDAESCKQLCERELFQVEGAEGAPKKVSKGCNFAVNRAHWHNLKVCACTLDCRQCLSVWDGMCEVADLQERRRAANDVSPVEGIASHYHFRFISEGKLLMRWLACPCDRCFDKDWDGCMNTPFYGDWIPRKQQELQKKGVSAHHQTRLQEANALADKVKDGMNVAIFTQLDKQGHRFWIGRAVGEPWQVPRGQTLQCPVSDEKFDSADRVLRVHYYDRCARSDDRFTFKPKLGTFIVRTALLRRVDVVLEMVEEPVCPGFTSVLVKYFDLSDLEFTHIMNAIVHEYKDNE